MRVRRADATSEIELSGTPSELFGLAEMLRSNEGSIALVRSGDPSPYTRMVSHLRVARAVGPVVVQYVAQSDLLEVRGGDKQLVLFALNVSGFADEGDPSAHLHVDYFPGHDYLAEDSEPIVIALSD